MFMTHNSILKFLIRNLRDFSTFSKRFYVSRILFEICYNLDFNPKLIYLFIYLFIYVYYFKTTRQFSNKNRVQKNKQSMLIQYNIIVPILYY